MVFWHLMYCYDLYLLSNEWSYLINSALHDWKKRKRYCWGNGIVTLLWSMLLAPLRLSMGFTSGSHSTFNLLLSTVVVARRRHRVHFSALFMVNVFFIVPYVCCECCTGKTHVWRKGSCGEKNVNTGSWIRLLNSNYDCQLYLSSFHTSITPL